MTTMTVREQNAALAEAFIGLLASRLAATGAGSVAASAVGRPREDPEPSGTASGSPGAGSGSRGEAADPQDLAAGLRRRQADLLTGYGALAQDEAAAGHLVLVTAIIAGYELACTVLPEAEAVALVGRSWIDPVAEDVRGAVAAVLDAAPDPFATLVEASRAQQEHFYGPGFVFETTRDDHDEYVATVRRCFYHQVFTAAGVPQLTRIMCDWDGRTWGAAIDPERHGLTFTLPATIGRGGDGCPFVLRRTPAAGA